MTANRRRTARVACILTSRWKRGGKVIETHLEDVNADGMLISLVDPYPLNQVMDLVVELPTGPIAMLVVSRSHHGGALGVSILAMDPEDRVRWTEYYRVTARSMGLLPAAGAAAGQRQEAAAR